MEISGWHVGCWSQGLPLFLEWPRKGLEALGTVEVQAIQVASFPDTLKGSIDDSVTPHQLGQIGWVIGKNTV